MSKRIALLSAAAFGALALTATIVVPVSALSYAAGAFGAKAFLGDCLDFQVEIGDFILLARAHPSLRTPVGGRVYVRMRTEKCVAVRDQHGRADRT